MLTMTPTAATALADARSQKGAPDSYGVRFFATPAASSEQARLAFKFVASPEPDDTVVDEGGLKAFVAPEVDQVMGDVVVDVTTSGEQPEFVLKRAKDEA